MTNQNGFFPMPRTIKKDMEHLQELDIRLLLLVLSSANHSESYTTGNTTLKRGQWLRSYRKIQQDLEHLDGKTKVKPSLSSIHRSVERLTRNGTLSASGTQSGTLFTLSESFIPKASPIPQEADVERDVEHQNDETRNNNNNNYLNNNKLTRINNNHHHHKETRARKYGNFYDTYFQFFGRMLNPKQREILSHYISDEEVEEEMVCFAIEYSSTRGTNFNYVTTVINNWICQGIKTYDKALIASQSKSETNRGLTDGERRRREELKKYDWGF